MSVDPVVVLPATVPSPTVVLTVEHATNRMPPGWSWPEDDLGLVPTHWASDPGIDAFARDLADRLGLPAVLSRFSRLLIDPNRPLDSDTLFRAEADGRPIALNRDLDASERARRIEALYEPYHAACDALVASHPGAVVLGLHSFTDRYEDQVREVQIGVLYDLDADLGQAWYEALRDSGYDTRINEPWSGVGGFMFGPQSHATRHGRRAVELELRQDLLADPVHHARLVELVADAIRQLHG